MRFQRVIASAAFVGALLIATTIASAQPLGTFRWRFAPFCNVTTLSVVQQGPVYVLSGFDDNCGAGNASSVTGTAFLNPNGGIGMGLTTIATGGNGVTTSIQISPSTFSGTWSDSEGNTGTFTFAPQLPTSGSARPVATGPSGLTTVFNIGTAMTLEPRRCYAFFNFGVGAPTDAGKVAASFLRSSTGQAVVNNLFVMLPGTVNLTTQGGTLGFTVGCNLSSGPQTLPAGWQLGTKVLTIP